MLLWSTKKSGKLGLEWALRGNPLAPSHFMCIVPSRYLACLF